MQCIRQWLLECRLPKQFSLLKVFYVHAGLYSFLTPCESLGVDQLSLWIHYASFIMWKVNSLQIANFSNAGMEKWTVPPDNTWTLGQQWLKIMLIFFRGPAQMHTRAWRGWCPRGGRGQVGGGAGGQRCKYYPGITQHCTLADLGNFRVKKWQILQSTLPNSAKHRISAFFCIILKYFWRILQIPWHFHKIWKLCLKFCNLLKIFVL